MERTDSRFEDHFSAHAAAYARFRPRYPKSLYAYLAAQCDHRRLAWDCATGSGQAAVALRRHFDVVVASDASLDQLSRAERRRRVVYVRSLAEHAPLGTKTVDLVTVAEAVHWFELEAFYREISRVLRDDGALAVWGYHMVEISPPIDVCLERFNRQRLRPYWPDGLRLLEEHYSELPFPFEEIETPRFTMQSNWNLSALIGFISTWSGVRALSRDQGWGALEGFLQELSAAWGDPERQRRCRWRLFMRLGRRRRAKEK